MNKDEFVKLYNEMGYRTLEIPINPEDPKALIRVGWDKEETNQTIGEDNLYAVVQEDVKLVIDIDVAEFNDVLDDFQDKTLIVKTANGGTHNYFKDFPRVEKYRIKTSKLYHNGKTIGDIKAHMSYVIGAGGSYFDKKDNKTKTYEQISSVDTVLETDCYDILKILKDRGITTEKNVVNRKFEDGLQVGERNNECFKTTCNLFEKEKLDFEAGLNFIKTWNKMSKNPLPGSEIQTIVKSAWDAIRNKAKFDGIDKIANAAAELKQNHHFLTLRKTEECLLFNGKIYDRLQADTIIKEETEKLIPNCTTHHRREVVNKIKAQTYTNLEKFDADPNLITVENGILNLESMELTSHTPEHLSRVLLPVKYIVPKYEIREESIFEDIEKNLEGTLFWTSLKSSFTVYEIFRKNDFETVLEIISSTILKRHVDEKAFIFLGQGENGKSVFLGYIVLMIGKNNVSNIPLQDIAEDKFMRANLSGMSANIFPDLEQNELKHTGKIKAITSNEGIEVQKKHQQGFTLYPFCKLLFSCNRFPKVFDQTQGFFRRWIIVKWDRNFENDPERIQYLRVKLAENIDEINLVFSCLVSIANKLNKMGKFTNSKDWKTIQKEWNENADPIDDFDSNYIITSEKHKTKRETYQFYKETMLSKGESPLGIGQFSKAFSEYHDEDKTDINGSTQRVWFNIDFKRPIQTTLKENDDTKP